MTANDKVWLLDEECVGTVVTYGSYFSVIEWVKDGIVYIEHVENSDFVEYEAIDE